ncbi:MAG TPA: transporter substrate-binding domain-containing protein [Firmicutes bacterium]|nr:transporter substrate-binding domain-containing protein [Bacillota bacterium]
MKKLIASMVALVMMFSFAACSDNSSEGSNTEGEQAQSQSLDAIKEAGEIVMFTNAEFPPFEYRDDNNEIAGVDVDIANEIANDIGVELVIEDVNFDSIVTSVQSGKAAFGAAGMTITDERKENVDFSIEYVTSKQYVILPEGTTISTIEDLDGMNIGVQTGTTGDFIIGDAINGTDDAEPLIPNATSNGYTSAILAAQDLLSGRLDAVVIDRLPAENIATVNADAGLTTTELLYADGSDTTEEYAICVQKGNTELLEAINATLQRLIDEGKIDEFLVNHTAAAAVE